MFARSKQTLILDVIDSIARDPCCFETPFALVEISVFHLGPSARSCPAHRTLRLAEASNSPRLANDAVSENYLESGIGIRNRWRFGQAVR